MQWATSGEKQQRGEGALYPEEEEPPQNKHHIFSDRRT